LRGVRELGFLRPTPIQAEAIPPIMNRRDVIACAETGSGKTAAFMLPIVHRLIDRPRGTTRVLVLAPTRELAAQIREDLTDLAVHTPITGFAIFGGVDMRPQEHALRSGTDIIIATPGRLLDHLRAPYADFSKLEILVLDEADRMLDMGFLPDIRRILRGLPAKRQTLLFSATMPKEMLALTGELMHDPVTIGRAREAKPASSITQALYPVRQDLKSALLAALLTRGDVKQALVFTRTKHRANRLAAYLVAKNIHADRIHGNRSQAQRTAALAGFKGGRTPVLVATDIAARGIDVAELGHVINFDVPLVPDDYIHRVGRTGRAQAAGDAFTFVSPEEERDLAAIERAIGRRLPRVTVPDFDYGARAEGKLEIPIADRLRAMREQRGRRHHRGGESPRGGHDQGPPRQGARPPHPHAPQGDSPGGGNRRRFRPRRRR
jgi:ATP-dependent RNA helicase RhlE